MLSNEIKIAYTEILKEELHSAMGCTEPIAIAYAASIVTELLGGEPEELSVDLSANIIKNVKSVIVPATGGMSGIESALAAGVISASPRLKLEVLTVLGDGDVERIRAYKTNAKMQIKELLSPCTFDLYIKARRGESSASVRISGGHTDVVLAELDGTTRKVRDLMPIGTPVSIDYICTFGLEASEVMIAFTMLEFYDLADAYPGGLYCRK